MKRSKRTAIPMTAVLSLAATIIVSYGSFAAKKSSYAAPAPPTVVAQAAKVESTGLFRDSAGKNHAWRISTGHTLYWDDKAYMPVGGAFTPHVWVEGNNDANWALDQAALETLKKHHISDVILTAGSYGLIHVHAAAVQRVLDYLDANGFHYGINIADFPKDPLIGYVVRPAVYRDPSLPISGPARFTRIPGLLDAFFMLVSTTDGSVEESGDAQIINQDTAEVSAGHDPDDILLLYPQRVYEPGTPESRMPDIWKNYDDYRDSVLAFFTHVKLGPGFRFFIDPLSDKIAMDGELQYFIPTSDGYRLEFEAWLNKRYSGNVDDLNTAWGIQDRDLPDFKTASRCLPLWYESKGLATIIDLQTRTRYNVLNKPGIRSTIWADVNSFRVESMRQAMNNMADALKRGVANVPVVYRWTEHNPIFTNDQTNGGYDGIGVEAYGHGPDLTIKTAAQAYAQADETAKTTWFLASSTMETSELTTKSDPGYESKQSLFADWDGLKNLNTRGFFTTALQLLPEDRYVNANLVDVPSQLDWLATYEAGLEAESDSLDAEQVPILWYPSSAEGTGVGVRQFANGVWWLPSYVPGQTLKQGDLIQGYRMASKDGSDQPFVIWSPGGKLTTARFTIPTGRQVSVFDTGGNRLQISAKKGSIAIPLGTEPVQITGLQTLPYALDALDQMAARVERLLKLAETQKINVQHYQEQYEYAVKTGPTTSDQVDQEYADVKRVEDALTVYLSPYAWIEGEDANPDTFDAIVPDAGASAGGYLSLDTDRLPPRDGSDRPGGYRADYKFTANAPGHYEIWLAGSPLDTDSVSPFCVSVDDDPPIQCRGIAGTGPQYGTGFVWTDLGQVTLQPGKHTLEVLLTGTRPADDRYALDIDTILVTRAPFTPNGTNRPPIDTLALDGNDMTPPVKEPEQKKHHSLL
jgi:hypothetical protein